MEPTGKSRPRLLVVEDEELMRRLLERNLRLHGWDVTAVSGGEAALAAAAAGSYDLALCDLMMEGLDGFQTLDRLAQAQPWLLRVVMTAYDTPENRHKADRLGVRAFVVKPFEMDALERLLRSLL